MSVSVVPAPDIAGHVSYLERQLWPRGFRRDIYMVVDCARDPRIYGLLLDCFYSDHTCLFTGVLSQTLQVSAPYLIPLEHDDAKTRKFLRAAWGNSWGVYLRSGTSLKALRTHLRRLLIVRNESNAKMMFRFYDPRVLSVYLPTCTEEELQTVFGPVETWFTDDRSFQLQQRKLVSISHHVTPKIPAGKPVELPR